LQPRIRFALSPIQQGLLFHHLSAPGSGADFEQIAISLREDLNPAALAEAWRRAESRHEVLRTRFIWEGVNEPVQEVDAEARIVPVVEDWTAFSAAERGERLARYLSDDRRRGFDLRVGPLARVAAFRFGPEHWEVVWSFPHIVLDGRSFPIVLGEVFDVYDALRRGESPALPEPHAYREHVAWLAARDGSRDAAFWRERLAGLAAPTPLPSGASAARAPLASPAATHPESARGETDRVLSREETDLLRSAAQTCGVTLNTLVQAAYALVLARHAGSADVVFGATRACRRSALPHAEAIPGLFINTLPVRVAIPEDARVDDWLRALRLRERAVRDFEHTPLVEVQAASPLAAGAGPLFQALLVFDDASLGARMRARGGCYAKREFRLIERTTYPLALYAYADPELWLRLAWDEPPFDAESARRLLDQIAAALHAIAADPARRVGELSIHTPEAERELAARWNTASAPPPEHGCIHRAIEARAAAAPNARALTFRDRTLSYAELDAAANRLAHHLRARGVGPDVPVALCCERSLELVIALVAIHKAGGAYVPLDPHYPAERLQYMREDSRAPVLVTQRALRARLHAPGLRIVELDGDADAIASEASTRCDGGARPEHLAYLIYTSGSTGKPKGVMVEHRNVANFFAGIDAALAPREPGVWLALTSLSFDISVLELCWTLASGFEVVISEDEHRQASSVARALPSGAPLGRPLGFSLFYFASAEPGDGDRYRLLLEGAKFADAHGFEAVWTPERHFHAFGGLYPNPAVTGAAIASITSRVAIRAGSVVIALHHPARIAEEWALVDNFSRGRVGISFASGWQPNDFVLNPGAFATAREQMLPAIETVKRLWRGEAVDFAGPDGRPVPTRTLPRPIQPELPVWLTAAGSPETFRRAGESGANILTHLLGQSLDELGLRIEIYRKARAERGLDPETGRVTLMLHTFVGDDLATVREAVRDPMIAYLRSSLGLIKGFANAWTAFKRGADGTAANADVDLASLSPEEMDGLLEYSFERYFETSALFGTPESGAEMIRRVSALGVDEVACLIDFGVETERALAHLEPLNRLRESLTSAAAEAERTAEPAGGAIPELIRRHRPTHLQCTPSQAQLLVADPDARAALGQISTLCIGGEAFPPALARELGAAGCREIWNLYGPTETTIWSAIQRVDPDAASIPLGRPLANQQLYVVDSALRLAPLGAAGELVIGGRGVTRGYWQRPELTAERFVPDRFGGEPGARLYRTGDLARRRADGAIEFLGRLDHQVKIRGHRIELGEIEAALADHANVREAVVIAREDEPGDQRLVAYLIPREGAVIDAAALRSALRERLPEFMVPGHFVALERFPQTPNRKVDRKALPKPEGAAPARAAQAASPPAQGEVEERIARIWQELLQVPQVSREDNFFDLGGHSLLAVKVHRRLTESFAKKIAITDLFRFPTVRALAEHLGGANAGPALEQSQDRGARRREMLAARRVRPAARRGSEAGES
jgi:natural product biosynthesis luciferase-like monooxygenase protein